MRISRFTRGAGGGRVDGPGGVCGGLRCEPDRRAELLLLRGAVGLVGAVATHAEQAQASLAAAVGEAGLAAAVVVAAAAVEKAGLGEEPLDLAQLLLLEADLGRGGGVRVRVGVGVRIWVGVRGSGFLGRTTSSSYLASTSRAASCVAMSTRSTATPCRRSSARARRIAAARALTKDGRCRGDVGEISGRYRGDIWGD